MLGGISRRAHVIDQVGAAPKLIIDAGNFASPNKDEFYRYKTEALLNAYVAIGYDAIALGPNEIMQGKDYILKMNDISGGKLVSANIIDEAGNLIVQPYITKDFGDLRVGIIGLAYYQTRISRTAGGTQPEVLTRDPIETLNEYLPVMRDKENCDLIIVAGILTQRNLEEIGKEFDGKIDVVLSGKGYSVKERRGGYISFYKLPEGAGKSPSDEAPVVTRDEANKHVTSIIYHMNGQSGKYLGKIHAVIEAGNPGFHISEFDGSTIELGDTVGFSPMIEEILDDFHARIQENRNSLVKDIINQRALHYWQDFPAYVGSRSCSECHQSMTTDYNMSDHSKSMRELTLKKENNNPDCLKCHTTAYGEPDGYRNRIDTYQLSSVGCESCHGPAREHLGIELELKDARKMNGKKNATEEQKKLIEDTRGGYDHLIRKEVPESICLSCHDSEWDPEFAYLEEVIKVNHSVPQGPQNPQTFSAEDGLRAVPNAAPSVPVK